jgi:PAS domain S-box-containing protein
MLSKNCTTLLESMPEGVILLDNDQTITYINQKASRITGYQPSEIINESIHKLFSRGEDEIIQFTYELQQARKSGYFKSETWQIRNTGEKYWAVIKYQYNVDGSGFSCTLEDLTDEKNHEFERKAIEERYRLMVEGVKDYAIFMLDPRGYISTWNDGAQKTKGYSRNEIIGKHFSIFYTAEDLESKKPERELIIAEQTGKYEEEGWRVKKNGSVFWANIVITALFNEQNKLIGFSKVTRDLTEKKYNEEALKQSEERYRSLVEQVTDYGIFMLDEKGRVISWNVGAKNISGYEADEIIGKYFSIFYTEEDIIKEKPLNELRIAQSTGKYEEEGWRLRKNGTRFWASIVITAVYNKNNTLIGYSKVTRDLTERKEAERALRVSYDRYRRLAAQLRHTNEELKVANKEMEQFTSIVSHDLQEPIRTIKSFLLVMKIKLEQKEYDKLQVYIDKSVQASNRMKELIVNLLNYSQLTKETIAEENVDVRSLIQEVISNMRASIESSKANIIIENTVDYVKGDPVQLVQVIQNLLSNALKFTHESSPEIRISCVMENGHPRFSISDNGIGIDQSDTDKIFEIFRRLNTSKDYPGTGIGLAICKKIVDRHNGRIWPESKPGSGTTFHFTLHEEMKGGQN